MQQIIFVLGFTERTMRSSGGKLDKTSLEVPVKETVESPKPARQAIWDVAEYRKQKASTEIVEMDVMRRTMID